ncbi:hypothetical protein [Mucilaginibacter myungsuensis]|uniref:Uncharacterized protein n=1 Tax=Mucilaginibacter myungsuensis TaxID=649104 RepID=A0A929L0P6_9SPHI|nr:hypothetical protein [Mucilaginibacter myungsuensis]MBE9664090.1 hypothetical protein [Mucilaginibacter myungsuensis]MDN3601269.1 hypothetical protein [Mucilaginibacter myungsuensis]
MSAQTGNSIVSPALNNKAITIFQQSVGDQSLLYNGPGYFFLRPELKTNPCLDDAKVLSPGSVVYYGYAYNNIPLMLDIERDLVITTWNDDESLMSLHSQKLSEFKLQGRHFIRIEADPANTTTPAVGFYDVLHNGKVQLLAKRSKILHIMDVQKGPDDRYEYKVSYYLKKGGKYLSVSGRVDLISTLGDHEDELKKHLKTIRSDFAEADMAKLASYYDTLTN